MAISQHRPGRRLHEGGQVGTEFRRRGLWQTLAILGMGRIGTEIARRHRRWRRCLSPPAAPVRCRWSWSSVSGHPALRRLHHVHMPLTDETKNMLNAGAWRRRKKACVSSTAPADLIDEGTRRRSRASKWLQRRWTFSKWSATADNPLRSVPNVVLTPHLSASPRNPGEYRHRSRATDRAMLSAAKCVMRLILAWTRTLTSSDRTWSRRQAAPSSANRGDAATR